MPVPRDGDNDGFVYDGTIREMPAPPKVPDAAALIKRANDGDDLSDGEYAALVEHANASGDVAAHNAAARAYPAVRKRQIAAHRAANPPQPAISHPADNPSLIAHGLQTMRSDDPEPTYYPHSRIIKGVYATFTPDGELQAVQFDRDPKVRARNEQIVRRQLEKEKREGHVVRRVTAEYWEPIMGREAWQRYLASRPVPDVMRMAEPGKPTFRKLDKADPWDYEVSLDGEPIGTVRKRAARAVYEGGGGGSYWVARPPKGPNSDFHSSRSEAVAHLVARANANVKPVDADVMDRLEEAIEPVTERPSAPATLNPRREQAMKDLARAKESLDFAGWAQGGRGNLYAYNENGVQLPLVFHDSWLAKKALLDVIDPDQKLGWSEHEKFERDAYGGEGTTTILPPQRDEDDAIAEWADVEGRTIEEVNAAIDDAIELLGDGDNPRYETRGVLLPAEERRKRYGSTPDEIEAWLHDRFPREGEHMVADDIDIDQATAAAQALDDILNDFPEVASMVKQIALGHGRDTPLAEQEGREREGVAMYGRGGQGEFGAWKNSQSAEYNLDGKPDTIQEGSHIGIDLPNILMWSDPDRKDYNGQTPKERTTVQMAAREAGRDDIALRAQHSTYAAMTHEMGHVIDAHRTLAEDYINGPEFIHTDQWNRGRWYEALGISLISKHWVGTTWGGVDTPFIFKEPTEYGGVNSEDMSEWWAESFAAWYMGLGTDVNTGWIEARLGRHRDFDVAEYWTSLGREYKGYTHDLDANLIVDDFFGAYDDVDGEPEMKAAPRDGDGDGFVYDGTIREMPVAPHIADLTPARGYLARRRARERANAEQRVPTGQMAQPYDSTPGERAEIDRQHPMAGRHAGVPDRKRQLATMHDGVKTDRTRRYVGAKLAKRAVAEMQDSGLVVGWTIEPADKGGTVDLHVRLYSPAEHVDADVGRMDEILDPVNLRQHESDEAIGDSPNTSPIPGGSWGFGWPRRDYPRNEPVRERRITFTEMEAIANAELAVMTAPPEAPTRRLPPLRSPRTPSTERELISRTERRRRYGANADDQTAWLHMRLPRDDLQIEIDPDYTFEAGAVINALDQIFTEYPEVASIMKEIRIGTASDLGMDPAASEYGVTGSAGDRGTMPSFLGIDDDGDVIAGIKVLIAADNIDSSAFVISTGIAIPSGNLALTNTIDLSMPRDQLSERLAYGTMVHELGHVIDIHRTLYERPPPELTLEIISKRNRLPDDTPTVPQFVHAHEQGESPLWGVVISAGIVDQAHLDPILPPADEVMYPSDYSRANTAEWWAETFTTWWLGLNLPHNSDVVEDRLKRNQHDITIDWEDAGISYKEYDVPDYDGPLDIVDGLIGSCVWTYVLRDDGGDGTKALPRDGDGDGMVYDGTLREMPVPLASDVIAPRLRLPSRAPPAPEYRLRKRKDQARAYNVYRGEPNPAADLGQFVGSVWNTRHGANRNLWTASSATGDRLGDVNGYRTRQEAVDAVTARAELLDIPTSDPDYDPYEEENPDPFVNPIGFARKAWTGSHGRILNPETGEREFVSFPVDGYPVVTVLDPDSKSWKTVGPDEFLKHRDMYVRNGIRGFRVMGVVWAHGAPVGSFERAVFESPRRRTPSSPPGKRVVSHSSLRLDPVARGKGFATAFNAQAEAAYRDVRIREIHLHTADVGGYAWARAGYDWNVDAGYPEEVMPEIGLRLTHVMSTMEPDDPLLPEAQALLRRVIPEEPEGEWPTPYEIASFGHERGIGKRLMVGLGWSGVKTLDYDDDPTLAERAVELGVKAYNPDARDADADRLVQEGTPFERPAAFLVDKIQEAAPGTEVTDFRSLQLNEEMRGALKEKIVADVADEMIKQAPKGYFAGLKERRKPDWLKGLERHGRLTRGTTMGSAIADSAGTDEQAIASVLADTFVAQWARSSSDHHALSIAIQNAIAELFDIEKRPIAEPDPDYAYKINVADTQRAVDEIEGKGKRDFGDYKPAIDAFVKAVYENTQRQLKAAGIDKVDVWRGIADYSEDNEGLVLDHGQRQTMEIRANPASSWAVERKTAEFFADSSSGNGLLLHMSVPASQVWSTAATGPGAIHESEIVMHSTSGMDVDAFGYEADKFGMDDAEWDAAVEAANTKAAKIVIDVDKPGLHGEDWPKRITPRKPPEPEPKREGKARAPRDGDGDGFVYDGTVRQMPVIPVATPYIPRLYEPGDTASGDVFVNDINANVTRPILEDYPDVPVPQSPWDDEPVRDAMIDDALAAGFRDLHVPVSLRMLDNFPKGTGYDRWQDLRQKWLALTDGPFTPQVVDDAAMLADTIRERWQSRKRMLEARRSMIVDRFEHEEGMPPDEMAELQLEMDGIHAQWDVAWSAVSDWDAMSHELSAMRPPDLPAAHDLRSPAKAKIQEDIGTLMLHYAPPEAWPEPEGLNALGPEFTPDRQAKRLAGQFVDQWAESASDRRPLSMAIQHVAADLFGMEEPRPILTAAGATEDARFRDDAIRDELRYILDHPVQRAQIEAYVKAVYANTQAWFAERGITEVTVWRGTSIKNALGSGEGEDPNQLPLLLSPPYTGPLTEEGMIDAGEGWGDLRFTEPPPGSPLVQAEYDNPARLTRNEINNMVAPGEITVQTNPLTSWAVDRTIAGGDQFMRANDLLLGTTVPVERVWSTSVTGPGCLVEAEVILLDMTGETMDWIARPQQDRAVYYDASGRRIVVRDTRSVLAETDDFSTLDFFPTEPIPATPPVPLPGIKAMPRDGDGDGFVYDGTIRQMRALSALQDVMLRVDHASGDCFEVAGRMIMNDRKGRRNLTLVHGLVMGQAGGTATPGKRHWHSWVEYEGEIDGHPVRMVIDKSNGNDVEMPAAVYYAVGRIQPEDTHRYSRVDALAEMIQAEHFGPWVDMGGHP